VGRKAIESVGYGADKDIACHACAMRARDPSKMIVNVCHQAPGIARLHLTDAQLDTIAEATNRLARWS
jgi:hypothetical protein